MDKKNKIIAFDTLKFLLIICIILYHGWFNSDRVGEYFHTANLAVECFFILSGFFIAKHYFGVKNIDSINKTEEFFNYFKGKIIGLYPQYFFILIFTIIIKMLAGHAIPKTFILNLLLFGNWGGIDAIINGIWYLVVYFWLSLFLYYLLLFYREKAIIFIIPTLAIISLFYMYNKYHCIFGYGGPMEFNLISMGTIRGLLGLSCGIFVYEICKFIENRQFNFSIKYLNFILGFLELLIICLTINLLLFKEEHSILDFNIYFYFGFLVCLIYFKKEIFLRFLNWNGWNKINYISYMTYMSHFIVVENKFVLNLLDRNRFWGNIIMVVLCIVFSYICFYLQLIFYRALKKYFIRAS